MRLIGRLHDLVTQPAPARPLAYMRMAVGLAGLVKAAAVLPVLRALTAPDAVRAPFAIDWFAFSSAAVVVLMAGWVLAAAALAAGWHARVAATFLAVAAWATLLADQQLYSNHLYLLSLMATLLALSDCGATLSLDARREGQRVLVPGYAVWLVRALVGIVYGFAALSKIGLAWLSGGVLALSLGTGLLSVPDAVVRVWILAPLALLIVLTEAFLACGLFVPRFRRVAAACGIALHLGILVFVGPLLELAAFTLLMVGVYPLFFADRAPLAGSVASSTSPSRSRAASSARRRRSLTPSASEA